MSKIVLTADIHFGVPGRLNDTVFACKVIDHYCRSVGIDTVIVLGDMFHDRKHLEIDVLVAATEFLENAQQKWIAFPGNHDMFLRHSWNITSLMPLKKHLTLINDVKILQLDSRRFWVLPFIQLETAYMNVVGKINNKLEEGDNLLTHIGICGATLNTCFLLKDWSIVNFNNYAFNKIYTGHFHSRQQINDNIWYPGSLIPFKFDEGDVPHGFYVYDTDTDTHKFLDIWKVAKRLFPEETPPPQFYTIKDTDLEKTNESIVNNNMIRIALTRDYTDNEKRIMKDKLTQMGVKAVRWLNLKQKIDSIENKLRDYDHTHDNRDLFKIWVDNDERGTKGLDKKILNDVHNEIIVEGDNLYVTEESNEW